MFTVFLLLIGMFSHEASIGLNWHMMCLRILSQLLIAIEYQYSDGSILPLVIIHISRLSKRRDSL